MASRGRNLEDYRSFNHMHDQVPRKPNRVEKSNKSDKGGENSKTGKSSKDGDDYGYSHTWGGFYGPVSGVGGSFWGSKSSKSLKKNKGGKLSVESEVTFTKYFPKPPPPPPSPGFW